MTQEEKIFDYMLLHGNIIQREAVKLGCYRLSARIYDLKKQGHMIITERVNVVTKDGSRANIGRYRIMGEE